MLIAIISNNGDNNNHATSTTATTTTTTTTKPNTNNNDDYNNNNDNSNNSAGRGGNLARPCGVGARVFYCTRNPPKSVPDRLRVIEGDDRPTEGGTFMLYYNTSH